MRSLYSTFALFTLLVMFISGLLAFFLTNTYYHHFLKEKNDDKYTEIAVDVANYIEEEEPLDLTSHLEHVAQLGYQMYLVDEEGNSSFFGKEVRDKAIEARDIQKVLNGDIYHGIGTFPKETFVTGFFANELKNSIGVPVEYKGKTFALFLRADMTLHFNEMRILFAWLLGLTIILSLAFELVLAKTLIQPLSKLSEATKKIKDGNFALSVDLKRKDEIGELARSFEDMSSQLGRLDTMRSEFISNVTHDFQSPLANIKGYAELLSEPDVTEEEREDYLVTIQDEATRLSNLTSQLLVLSSLNQLMNIHLEKSIFSLSDQLKSVVRKYQWQLNEKEISLQYSLPIVRYEGSQAYLLSVWENLLSNAIKYNKHGGSIFIKLNENPNNVEVEFRDTGIGLTKEEKKSLFERFYRADPSRSSDVTGTGLGLAIVEQVVHLHDGEIQIESEKGKGTTVIIKLPKQM